MSYLVSFSYTEYTLMSTFVYTIFFTLLEWSLPRRMFPFYNIMTDQQSKTIKYHLYTASSVINQTTSSKVYKIGDLSTHKPEYLCRKHQSLVCVKNDWTILKHTIFMTCFYQNVLSCTLHSFSLYLLPLKCILKRCNLLILKVQSPD